MIHLIQIHSSVIHLWISYIVLHQFDLKIFWQILVEFILNEKSIWTCFRIAVSIILKLSYYFRAHFVMIRQKWWHFDDNLFHLKLHDILKLITGNVIAQKHLLNLFNGIGVEQHTWKDQQSVCKSFNTVEVRWSDIAVTTCTERCAD